MTNLKYSIEIKGLEEQLKKLNGYGIIADEHLVTAMKKSVISIQSKVVPLVPVGVSGRLRNSIGTEVERFSVGNIQGKVGTSMTSEVYPQTMEFGRRPGAPGPSGDMLLRWVQLKLGISDEAEALNVAWRIARKIHRTGIKAKEFMKRGFTAAKSSVEYYFRQAIDEITKGLSNGR
jgi:hypothetical protein